MILFGYPICYCFWIFYSKILPHTYKKLEFNSIQQIILLVMTTLTLFVLFGAAGYSDYGAESHLIALLSIYAAPIVIVACWPLRKWVSSWSLKLRLEHGGAYRTAYWSRILVESWQEITQNIGVLPLYIPLHEVDVASRDIVIDYLKQNGFTNLRNACPLKLIGDSYQFIHKASKNS